MSTNFDIMYKELPTSLDQVGRVNAGNLFQQKVDYDASRELTNNVDNKPQGRHVSILDSEENIM